MTPRLRQILVCAIVWVLAFDIVWLWQRQSGAHTSEFGGHPDEPAHYVTGLMVHDYLAARFPGPPMKYAEDYYAHYPKVGLGVWPPVFYAVQAGWTLPFGTGRMSMMLLMAALTATIALLVFHALRREFSLALSLAGAGVFLCLPLVRELSGMIMAEILSAIFMFGAALAFGRFLDTGRARNALGFGVLAGLAILTKGTGLALAFVPLLAILLTQKWRVLARPALWGGAAICALLAGPWTWWFRDYGREKGGWLSANLTWDFTREAMPYYLGKFGLALGFVLLVFFAIGLLQRLLRPSDHRGMWASAAALVAGVLLFQCVLPVGLEDRHLLPAIPAAMLFVVAGSAVIDTWWQKHRGHIASQTAQPMYTWTHELVVVIVLALSAGLVHFLSPPERKHWSGFGELAEQVIAHDLAGKAVVLVSSDARGEGMFISELAMRERRPGRVVKRASKEIAKMDWAGRGARPRFGSSEELAKWLDSAGIDYIVTDASMPEDKREEHHDQLLQALEDQSARFWPMQRARAIRGGAESGEELVLYRVRSTAQ